MTYPPTVPGGDRIPTTPLPGNHAAEHNTVAAALTDIINELGADPKNGYASVTAAIADILADKLMPAGSAIEFHGDTAPTGWVFYRGQMITKASAPLTWARFGDLYGASTATDFYLPDRRKRVPVGLDTNVAPAPFAATLGQTGGSEDSVLIEHQHTVDPPNASVTLAGGIAKWINRLISGGGGTSILLNQSNYGGEVQQVTPTVNIPAFQSANAGASGEDGADKNLQPYIVVNYIGRLV